MRKAFYDIQAVCLDMSGIYRKVATERVPQAKIVHDKFHVFKHLNEAVDKVPIYALSTLVRSTLLKTIIPMMTMIALITAPDTI